MPLTVQDAIPALREAAARYDTTVPADQVRRDTCLDIANRIEVRGAWASDRQMAYAESLIQRLHPRGAATVTEHAISDEALARVHRLFAVANQNGLRRPRIALTINDYPLRLARAGDHSRNPGSVYVYRRNEYVGRVDAQGTFFPYGVMDRDGRAREALRAFGSDPLRAAAAHGHATGACCFCRRTLTDPRSVTMGYGPVCAERYGLDWGTHVESNSRTVTTDSSPAEREQQQRELAAARTRELNRARMAMAGRAAERLTNRLFGNQGVAARFGVNHAAAARQEQTQQRSLLPEDDEDRHFL